MGNANFNPGNRYAGFNPNDYYSPSTFYKASDAFKQQGLKGLSAKILENTGQQIAIKSKRISAYYQTVINEGKMNGWLGAFKRSDYFNNKGIVNAMNVSTSALNAKIAKKQRPLKPQEKALLESFKELTAELQKRGVSPAKLKIVNNSIALIEARSEHWEKHQTSKTPPPIPKTRSNNVTKKTHRTVTNSKTIVHPDSNEVKFKHAQANRSSSNEQIIGFERQQAFLHANNVHTPSAQDKKKQVPSRPLPPLPTEQPKTLQTPESAEKPDTPPPLPPREKLRQLPLEDDDRPLSPIPTEPPETLQTPESAGKPDTPPPLPPRDKQAQAPLEDDDRPLPPLPTDQINTPKPLESNGEPDVPPPPPLPPRDEDVHTPPSPKDKQAQAPLEDDAYELPSQNAVQPPPPPPLPRDINEPKIPTAPLPPPPSASQKAETKRSLEELIQGNKIFEERKKQVQEIEAEASKRSEEIAPAKKPLKKEEAPIHSVSDNDKLVSALKDRRLSIEQEEEDQEEIELRNAEIAEEIKQSNIPKQAVPTGPEINYKSWQDKINSFNRNTEEADTSEEEDWV